MLIYLCTHMCVYVLYIYVYIYIFIYKHVYTSKCTKMREGLILGIANFDRGGVLGQDKMGNLESRH